MWLKIREDNDDSDYNGTTTTEMAKSIDAEASG